MLCLRETCSYFKCSLVNNAAGKDTYETLSCSGNVISNNKQHTYLTMFGVFLPLSCEIQWFDFFFSSVFILWLGLSLSSTGIWTRGSVWACGHRVALREGETHCVKVRSGQTVFSQGISEKGAEGQTTVDEALQGLFGVWRGDRCPPMERSHDRFFFFYGRCHGGCVSI